MIPTSTLIRLAEIFAGIYLSAAVIGRTDLLWLGLNKARGVVIHEVNGSWGCPSVFDRNACGR